MEHYIFITDLDPSEVDDKESLEVKPTELEATVNEEEKKPLEPPPDIPISLPQELPMQPFIPEPEAPIDPTECRMRLLEHIEHFQNHIDSKLTTIEAHVCGEFLYSLMEEIIFIEFH